MELSLINAEIFEFDNYSDYIIHYESCEIDGSYQILASEWLQNRSWGFIIVDLGQIIIQKGGKYAKLFIQM